MKTLTMMNSICRTEASLQCRDADVAGARDLALTNFERAKATPIDCDYQRSAQGLPRIAQQTIRAGNTKHKDTKTQLLESGNRTSQEEGLAPSVCESGGILPDLILLPESPIIPPTRRT